MKTKSPPQARECRQPQEVSTITKEDLLTLMKQGQPIQIVNVPKPEGYAQGVIKGSFKIPLSELDTRAPLELDPSRRVITYCAGYHCHASREAAQLLAAKGYRVQAYEGGIEEWKNASLPLENPMASTALEPAPNAGSQDQPSGLSGIPTEGT